MKSKLIQFIWFEDQALKAANWYTSIFPESRIQIEGPSSTPPGRPSSAIWNCGGSPFSSGISANIRTAIPPSPFSYMAACSTVEETERIWGQMAKRAEVMMPFQEYPFSKKYGWLKLQG